jgi:hypothetical protein
MTRRTLRTMHRWLPAVLLIGLPLPIVAAKLPAEFLTLLNQLEFVGQFAIRCDTELTFRGLLGLQEHDCPIFYNEMNRAQQAMHDAKDVITSSAQLADQSGDLALQREWAVAMGRLNGYLEKITRTGDHVEFLKRAEEDTPKRPTPRRKK